jgi:short-subunit dehydrogenase
LFHFSSSSSSSWLTLLPITHQTNVKGTMTAANVFLPTANPTHAALLGLTTGTVSLPTVMLPGLSAYISSKLAQVKLLEFLAAENPNVFVASVHPGMVETAVFTKSGAKAEALPMDKG